MIGPETLLETVQDAEGSGTLSARSSFVCPRAPAGEAPASAVPMLSLPPLRRSEPKRIDISLRPFACCNCISLNDFKIRVNALGLNGNTTPHPALSLHSRSPPPRFPVLVSFLPRVERILSKNATRRKAGVTRGKDRASRRTIPRSPAPSPRSPVPAARSAGPARRAAAAPRPAAGGVQRVAVAAEGCRTVIPCAADPDAGCERTPATCSRSRASCSRSDDTLPSHLCNGRPLRMNVQPHPPHVAEVRLHRAAAPATACERTLAACRGTSASCSRSRATCGGGERTLRGSVRRIGQRPTTRREPSSTFCARICPTISCASGPAASKRAARAAGDLRMQSTTWAAKRSSSLKTSR